MFDNLPEGLPRLISVGRLDLTSEGLLLTSDVAQLHNAPRLPVMTALTCLISQFAYPSVTSLGEELVLRADGGAAAACAEGLGLMTASLRITRDYISQREQFGLKIGSFQALCDIVGPRFFAFAMITGARITSLLGTEESLPAAGQGALSAADVRVASFAHVKPSLHQIFLQKVGAGARAPGAGAWADGVEEGMTGHG